MSKASSISQSTEAPEEDNSIITKFGEEPKENIAWMRRLERGLYRVFSVILEEQRTPTFLACVLILISFLQTYGLDFRSGGNHHIRDSFFDDAVQLFGTFGLVHPIISNDNNALYFAIAYALFAVQLLYFVGLFAVHKYDESEKKQYSLIVAIQSFMTPIMYWVLPIPTSQFFSSIFKCALSETEQRIFANLSCWGPRHMAHVCVFSLGYFLCLLNTILIATLGNDCNPFNSSNAFRRFSWSFELFYAVFRIAFSFAIQHISDSSYCWAYELAMLASSVFFASLYLRHCLYYDVVVRKLFGLCLISLTWICINSLIFEIAYLKDMTYRGRTAITVLGMTCSYYLSDRLQEYYCDVTIMTRNLYGIDNDETVEICLSRLLSLSTLSDSACLTEEESCFLLGYLFIHKKECHFNDCPMEDKEDYYFPLTKEVSKKDGRTIDDRVRLKFLISRIYHDKIATLANQHGSYGETLAPSTRLFLSCAYYQICVIGNRCVGGFILEEAQLKSSSFWMKGAIYRAKRFLEQNNYPLHSSQGENLDVRLVLEYEAHLASLKKRLVRSTELQRKFCGELLLPRPNLNAVYKLGLELIDACESVPVAWDRLCAMDCDDPKAHTIYGVYLASIRGKYEEANEHLTRAKSIEAAASDSLKDKASMFAEGTAVIAAGSSKDNIGKIIKANNGITNKFEYAPADLVGKDVSILMPGFLGKNHTGYVSDYIKSGCPRIINKPYETYGVSKENYIFTLYLYVREYYSLEHSTVFLGLLSPRLREEATILTDMEGRILGISYGVYAAINELNPAMFNGQDIYMFYVCPELSTELQGNDYASYEGSLMLTFSVPNNLQTISLSINTKLALYISEDFGSKEYTAQEIFRSEFSSALDYIGCYRLSKWCTIANKVVGNGSLKFKVITFSQTDNMQDDASSTEQKRDVDNILDSDLLVPEAGPETGLKKVTPARRQRVARTRAKRLKSTVLGNLDIKSEMLSKLSRRAAMKRSSMGPNDLLKLRTKDFASQDNAGDAERGAKGEAREKLPLNIKEESALSKSFTMNADVVKDDRAEENPQPKPKYNSDSKDIRSFQNSSFSKYTPKSILYAQRATVVLLLLLLGMGTLAFAYYCVAFDQVDYTLQMASWTRAKEASCIFENIRSLTLMAPASDGKPLLNSSLRNTYNYASVYYANNLTAASTLSQTMDYTQWKLAELQTLASRLNRFDYDIQKVFIKTNDGNDVIIPGDITWMFNTTNGMRYNVSKQVTAHSLLTLIVNEATRVGFKAQGSTLESIPAEFQLLSSNWYSNIAPAFEKSPGVTIEPIRPAVNRSERVALIALATTCSAIVLCLVGTAFLLQHVTAEISEMLHFFVKITARSLRAQIEKCTELANLLSFDSNIDQNRDREYLAEESPGEESGEELHGETSDQEELKTNKARTKKEHKKVIVEYSGNFWCRLLEVLAISCVLCGYFLYCYLGVESFYDVVECHLYELATINKLSIKNEGMYMFALEDIGSNGTTKYNGIPILYLASNFRSNLFYLAGNVSKYHDENKGSYSSAYNRIYESVFLNMSCTSAVVSNVTECMMIYDGGLSNGLYLANLIYIEALYQTMLSFLYTPAPKRTLGAIRSLLNSNTFIVMERINKKYFFPLYLYITNAIQKSMNDKVHTESTLFVMIYVLFLIALVIVYLVCWRLYANSIRKDLFSSKLLFAYLPLEIIIDSRASAKLVAEYSKQLVADMGT